MRRPVTRMRIPSSTRDVQGGGGMKHRHKPKLPSAASRTVSNTHRGHALPCTAPAGENHAPYKESFLHKYALKGFTPTHSSAALSTPESCGALHNPCGGAPHKESITPQTRPNRLHNPRLLIQAPCTSALVPYLPFFRLTSCVLHAHTHLTPQHLLLCHLR